MKTEFVLFAALILFSCSTPPEPETVKTENTDTTTQQVSNYSLVERLFENITPDSLYVFSGGSYDSKYLFTGKQMDSAAVSVFEEYDDYWRDHFATFKFAVSDSKTVFLLRVPGEYEPSVIRLFVFDIERDSVVNSIQLADGSGDAGETWGGSSCIITDEKKDILVIRYEYYTSDHSVWSDEPGDTLTEEHLSYSLFNLTSGKQEPVSTDSVEIVTKYKNIIDKLRNH